MVLAYEFLKDITKLSNCSCEVARCCGLLGNRGPEMVATGVNCLLPIYCECKLGGRIAGRTRINRIVEFFVRSTDLRFDGRGLLGGVSLRLWAFELSTSKPADDGNAPKDHPQSSAYQCEREPRS
ncbi:hypothetical protein NJB14197_06260 [Mycobacterium montefiorense]|uniref:Uncharacterized protein n=1 Tax=Mycobacterium montefiorense TaxID=154654 RepID=A0AA37UVN0_9MYCO|nr:hypothetical protein MmonteBS_36710 [Mycobacterium montefiorense]GKU37675.1 hypothetical protein NJB14191_50210 [Mycobacterium montefiorense]GKU41880.1 hypothetical protein NJB14192_38630 [Mycobacterium montefiorense]GKU45663.1 hypothetical protein NJB14194_22840 [Mycobacterium montefiorense]GKU53380.1 hypothetical protein NJB14195_46210 [Mycobacterium montefiorense]